MLRGLLQTNFLHRSNRLRGGDDASLFWLRLASSNYTPLKRNVNHRFAKPRPVGPLSDETLQSDETPGVAMHRGSCFSGLKRP